MLPSAKPTLSRQLSFDTDAFQNDPPIELVSSIVSNEIKDTLTNLSYFSNSSVLKELKNDLILQKKLKKFNEKVSSVLQNIKSLNLKDDKQLHTLFLFVMQSAEDYLTTNHTDNSLKEEACISLLKPFVKNDALLCKQIMGFVQYKIKPSTFWRRNKKNLLKLSLFFLNKL